METIDIARQFALEGEPTGVKPLGNGLINDTFKVSTDGPHAYVLQRINNAIFQDVDMLQHNISAVTNHIRAKLAAAGEKDLDRKVLKFLPLKDSPKTYWTDGKTYWRVSLFIPDAFTQTSLLLTKASQFGRLFTRSYSLFAGQFSS